ncbi:hypothetical protein GJ496_005133 [Pomphorhynchus laevis]|nr:hypothetical protein GJ496_005133 [Pomphorhynchus laevis]
MSNKIPSTDKDPTKVSIKRRRNVQFPPARVKRIIQKNEKIGKLSSCVPVMVSRALEQFIEQLVGSACEITLSRGAKTLTPLHIQELVSIRSTRFSFLQNCVKKSSIQECLGQSTSSYRKSCGTRSKLSMVEIHNQFRNNSWTQLQSKNDPSCNNPSQFNKQINFETLSSDSNNELQGDK